MQVSQRDDLANWMVPGKIVKGMGGAMDLVAGARRIVVLMEHVDRDGAPKLIPECTLPLTGRQVVDILITNLAVFRFRERGGRLELVELASGVTIDDVRASTTAAFDVALAAQ